MNFIIIETTFPNLEQAEKLAEILLKEKLAACVQFKTILSMYSWQGNIEKAEEIAVKIKTREDFFKKISAIIKKNHPYKVPEIIGIKMDVVSDDYANWLKSI